MRTFLWVVLIVGCLVWLAPGLLSSLVGTVVGITASGLTALLIVGAVMLVVGLVFGSTLLALLAGLITLLFVGFSLLWPLLLVFVIIWLLTRSPRTQAR